MRRFAFIITILGLLALLVLLNKSPIQISNQEQLKGLEINTPVSITGKVIIEENIYETQRLLTLENNIKLTCQCPQNLRNKEISILGIVSEYDNEKQITILKIKT